MVGLIHESTLPYQGGQGGSNLKSIFNLIKAIPIVVRYRVLGFEESGVRSQESGVRIQDSGVRIRDSGVKILVYLMRLGNAIVKLPTLIK